MTTKHTVAAFNHSCLKVPINPANKLPVPTFERKRVSNYFENDNINMKGPSKGRTRSSKFLPGADCPSSSDSREGLSNTSTPQDNANSTMKTTGKSTNNESLQAFIDFYASIPDYGDLNHLTDREFYVRLQNLKAKQRTYLEDLDKKDFGIAESVEENKLNTRNNLRKMSAPSQTWLRHCDNSLNLQSRKCDLDDKSPVPNSAGYHREVKRYSDPSYNSSFWDKLDSNNYVSPTVSAVSLQDTYKILGRNNPKSSMQLNNYMLDTEEPEGVSGTGLISSEILDKESKFKGPLPQRDSYKIKAKRPNATNKIRDTHALSTNKGGTLIDCSSSIIDSLWDGISIDEYVSRAELFSDSDSGQGDALDLAAVSHSVPNSPALKHNKTVAWQEPKITVPKPFNMTLREEEDQHINLLRYQLYGGDNLDESKEEPKIIRAHPVPLESQLPLFDKIMAEQEHS